MKVKNLKNGSYKKIIGTKYFIVDKPYLFLLILYGKKYHIKVPRGFITDLGSIPPIFFYLDKSKYISYILHDYLYNYIGIIINISGELEYDQGLADDILIAGLEEEGMIVIGRVQVLTGLTLFGGFAFKKKDKQISKQKKLLPKHFFNEHKI